MRPRTPCATASRPIGHIAGSLSHLAISVMHRMRHAKGAMPYVCWVDETGCVYLASETHGRAKAMLATAPEQLITSYGKNAAGEFPLTTRDIAEDLTDGRLDHARRELAQAAEAA